MGLSVKRPTTQTEEAHCVVCREVTDALPDFLPGPTHPYSWGRWHYLEAHSRDAYGPVAMLTAHETSCGVELMDLFVVDDLRGKGFAHLLMRAARETWPRAVWTDSPASRGFHQRLVAEGLAVCTSEANAQFFLYAFAPAEPHV